MIIMRMIGGTFLFILVGLVLLLALLQRARRMQAQVEPKGEWASCAECHQTARNMPEYRYRHGRAMIWGHLCHDCAQKFGAERA